MDFDNMVEHYNRKIAFNVCKRDIEKYISTLNSMVTRLELYAKYADSEEEDLCILGQIAMTGLQRAKERINNIGE